MDEAAKIDKDIIDQMFALGFMGVEIDAKHGGTGMGFLSSCLVIEELAKVDAAVSVMCDVQNTLVINVFNKYSSQAIQDYALPKLAKDTIGCFCLSEAGSGSDAFALTTRADKKGDFYEVRALSASRRPALWSLEDEKGGHGQRECWFSLWRGWSWGPGARTRGYGGSRRRLMSVVWVVAVCLRS